MSAAGQRWPLHSASCLPPCWPGSHTLACAAVATTGASAPRRASAWRRTSTPKSSARHAPVALTCGCADGRLRQELALTQLRDVVCDHVANVRPACALPTPVLTSLTLQPRPRKPLVVSLNGPPGVGKTFYHKLLAESLYNMTGLAGRAPSCDPGGQDCPGYRVIFGTDYLAAERDQQASRLRASVLGHLQKYPESVLVIEEYDKVDCQSRSMLRQLLDKGISGNVSAARSIIVLEANTGSSHMYKLLQKAGSRERLSPELAHRSLKDVLYSLWMADRCGEAIETQKMLSLIDAFVPLLPLERRHIRVSVPPVASHAGLTAALRADGHAGAPAGTPAGGRSAGRVPGLVVGRAGAGRAD